MTKIICGVDVSKARLDAAVSSPSVCASFANNADGIAALAGFGRTHGVELAVMEATGGFERKAFLLLWQPGVACALVVGLAPLADDSGRRSGQRHIRGGRASVRSILFLVVDIARRFDDGLAAMHRRLTEAGKKKMVIRVALAHKLLVRLNAKASDARADSLMQLDTPDNRSSGAIARRKTGVFSTP